MPNIGCDTLRLAAALSVYFLSALVVPLPASAQNQLPKPAQLPPVGGVPAASPPASAAPQAAPKPAQPAQPALPQQQAQQPAPPKPYAIVTVKPPAPFNDPGFASFRQQLADIAKRKDRAALQKLVVTQGFFWEGETGDKINKRKSSFDNFATAIGLNDKDGAGWEIVATAAAEPTLEPAEDRKGVMCGPASPQIDDAAFETLVKATGTDGDEWGFPRAAGLEVRAEARSGTPIIEKLGMHLVRVIPEDNNATQPPEMLRVVTPVGKTGYVAMDELLPAVFDQMCYVKDAAGWKITGYVGGE
jgi:hypothetical protein